MIGSVPQPGAASWFAGHRKAIIAAGGSLAAIAVQTWGTSNPWVAFAVLTATSLGVYRAPNTPPATIPGRPAVPALPADGGVGTGGEYAAGAGSGDFPSGVRIIAAGPPTSSGSGSPERGLP